jgi:hypothetical protein
MIELCGTRIRIFDEKGNLICERDATLEDLFKAIIDEIMKLDIDFEFTVAGQTVKVRAKLGKGE